MGPDFDGPDGPGYGHGFGHGYGHGYPPGFEHHFHHGPHFPMVMDWWPVLGSLLMTLLVVAILWAGGLALLTSQVTRGPRAAKERVDWRARWNDAVARHNVVAEAFARFECDAHAVLATPGAGRRAPGAHCAVRGRVRRGGGAAHREVPRFRVRPALRGGRRAGGAGVDSGRRQPPSAAATRGSHPTSGTCSNRRGICSTSSARPPTSKSGTPRSTRRGASSATSNAAPAGASRSRPRWRSRSGRGASSPPDGPMLPRCRRSGSPRCSPHCRSRPTSPPVSRSRRASPRARCRLRSPRRSGSTPTTGGPCSTPRSCGPSAARPTRRRTPRSSSTTRRSSPR